LKRPQLTKIQLGGTGADEAGNYVLGDDALACLRDLKRWLKLYDEKNNRLDVARCLAEANLVNGDIIPILAAWTEEASHNRSKARLALACLELLVPLTWPLEHAGGMTANHHRHTPYIQQAHVRYKAGVMSYDRANILRTIVRIGLPSIATSKDDRTSRDEGIIKLMLYFFRNISIITPLPNLPNQGLDNEISRSATIEAFRQEDVLALLLTLCSNMGEDFNLQDVIVLEIIFNLIKGVDVEKLFMNKEQRKIQKTSELKDVLGKEKGMHRDYAKIAPTRHGRFGTMIWVKRDDEKVSTISGQDNLKDGRNSLLKMDKSKKWSKPLQRRKDLDHSIHDFDRSVRLSEVAGELLRNFVEEFLDSGFNPLFTHLRKAIEREADRLLDINYRQFFYTVSWFLQAERCRRARQEKDRKNQKVQTEFEAESYGLVAGVLNQETFITLNRYTQTSFDNKEWQDLSASMRCFTQILLTVQEMAQSSLEDDQEIADNIQNRIFYEETTHDRIVSILKGYKDQGFGYLDACTELSHVFLRMLERYSKENNDLQIRSRRRARRKKKEEQKEQNAGNEDDDDDAQSENEDIAEAAQVSRERKFDFTRFAAKFTSQSSVDTFLAFTAFYRDLSIDQLKRAHRFFYRVAFKQELAVLLYRVDIISLFYKLIKGPEGLDRSHAMYKEWDELVRQVLKRMFKKLEQRPELIVEMLFSKIRATLYYLEYGHEKQTISSIRTPVELEVKSAPGRDVNEQIGIVVAALIKDENSAFVRWVLETVAKAADERKAWEAEAIARLEISGASLRAQAETTAMEKQSDRAEPKAPFMGMYNHILHIDAATTDRDFSHPTCQR
jgi:replication fork protection complex subunit Tof1/Swi1